MTPPNLIYLDNNATTRVAPEVVSAMLPFLTEHWGNPSSAYRFGYEVARHLVQARVAVAALIHVDPREIIFTSCGTESNNSAIHSALVLQPDKRHIVTTAVEHMATLHYCEHLTSLGYQVTRVPVAADGSLDLEELERSIQPDTAIVSVMWANNETGVLFPIQKVAAICRRKGVLVHTDAVQAAGKLEIDAQAAGVDFLSLSGHKMHAPKGIGALYVRRQTRFAPFIIGGGQERGRRAGTENVANIIAFGKAAELAMSRLTEQQTRVRTLRDRLESGILENIPGTARNGAKEPRLPNTSNIAFDAVEAEAIMIQLDQLGICVSSGSACKSGSLEPSHVLMAMSCSPARARGSLRFSLGIDTTSEDIDHLLEHLPAVVKRLRALSFSPLAMPSVPTAMRS